MLVRTRIAVYLFAMGCALCLLCVHCAETRRSLGEECLRNEDCLSNVCSARSCVNPPPTTNNGNGSELPTPTLDASSVDANDGGG